MPDAPIRCALPTFSLHHDERAVTIDFDEMSNVIDPGIDRAVGARAARENPEEQPRDYSLRSSKLRARCASSTPASRDSKADGTMVARLAF